MKTFDLIIIGGGPGGYPLALRMARQGWQVALVEKDEVGGTCLNRGCIPTKALLASAKGLHFMKNAANLGLQCEKIGFDWQKILTRKNNVVSQLRNAILKLLHAAKVTLFKGEARLFSNNRVKIRGTEDHEIEGKKICLAVGSVPSVPKIFPDDKTKFWTSDEALSAPTIPESLLIIGGGVIGMELGQVFNEFGSKVTVVEMMPQILPGLDSAVAKRILPVFKKAGMEILTGQKVENAMTDENGISAEIGGEKRSFTKAILAAGRKPNFSFLTETGLNIETSGNFVQVENGFETSIPEVYAIGDVIPGPMLAHKASYDAFILAGRLEGKKALPDYSTVPACVYTYPEIAWMGSSEDELQKTGKEYKTGRFLFSANGKALTAAESEGQVKTLVDSSGKLLGTTIWGPEAGNLIVEAVMMKNLAVDHVAFSGIIHPHPTLSEAFMEAFENSMGLGIHG